MKVEIRTPQFERLEELDFEYIPKTEGEFHKIINDAPWDTLKGMGFRKWATMNELIEDNKTHTGSKVVEVPIYSMDDVVELLSGGDAESNGSIKIDLTRKDAPTELLEQDMDIIMFPGEWFNAIPDGFMATGLHGEQEAFYKSLADDDIRFGILAYGFQRPVVQG